jgi:hypothetical protein
VVRVAVTAVLADRDPDFATGFYHFFSGWVLFLAGFGLLLAVQLSMIALARKSAGAED